MFDGVRVVEVAQWVFVPACGAVLADLGAEVIKVEHPLTGDASRGLVIAGHSKGTINLRIEQNNRGKQSVGLDLKQPEGRALLYRLIERADVFITNFRADALERLDLGVEALRERNPKLVYARGHGLGVRGPDAGRPGYDAISYWSRGGLQHALSPPEVKEPVRQRPAFGDHTAAMNLAFGIAAALYKRERTGEPSVVDVSLLSTALWSLSSDVAAAQFEGYKEHVTRDDMTNALVNSYRTKDGRWLQFVLLEPDRYWADLCAHMDRKELIADPRFVDATVRAENVHECIALLDEIFALRTYAEWCERLSTFSGPWEPIQTVREVHDDPQTLANDYIFDVEAGDGTPFKLVGNPTQFDEVQATGTRSPEVGEHTEQVLLELGLSWDEIAAHKKAGVIT